MATVWSWSRAGRASPPEMALFRRPTDSSRPSPVRSGGASARAWARPHGGALSTQRSTRLPGGGLRPGRRRVFDQRPPRTPRVDEEVVYDQDDDAGPGVGLCAGGWLRRCARCRGSRRYRAEGIDDPAVRYPWRAGGCSSSMETASLAATARRAATTARQPSVIVAPEYRAGRRRRRPVLSMSAVSDAGAQHDRLGREVAGHRCCRYLRTRHDW